MTEIPLKVVPDEIARPPGEQLISSRRFQFHGGTICLPDGNTFRIASGSITFTWDAGNLPPQAVRHLAARLEELARQVAEAATDIAEAIRMGTLNLAIPAGPVTGSRSSAEHA